MTKDIYTSAEAMENAAMPRLKEVHANPDVRCTQVPKGLKGEAQKSPAQWAYERMILYIQNFEKQLDSEHEIAMGFTGGSAGVLRIEGMGFFDPDIITFYGTDPTGTKTQMIQHVSQLNVHLRAVPKVVSQDAPQRIGFALAKGLGDDVTEPDISDNPAETDDKE